MSAIDPRAFWEAKILAWEDSRYGQAGQAPTLLERVAGRVSSSLRFRLERALALLAPVVAGRPVLELGCGSGLLAESLVAAGASSYRGIDFAATAVARARQRVAAGPHAARISFEAAAVTAAANPEGAVVLSLGLLDWLETDEIGHVLSLGRHGFLHAFSERRRSPQQWIHRLYVHAAYGRRTGGYAPRYHRAADLAAMAAEAGLPAPAVIRAPRLAFGAFLAHLPPAGPLGPEGPAA